MELDFNPNRKHVYINQDFSTIVVKLIIDKIFSKVFREISCKYYFIKIPKICVDYSIKMIDNLISITKIKPDINDIDELEINRFFSDKNNKENKIINSWIEIIEPSCTEKDRGMTNLLKVIPNKDNNNLLNSNQKKRNSLFFNRDRIRKMTSSEIIAENPLYTIYKIKDNDIKEHIRKDNIKKLTKSSGQNKLKIYQFGINDKKNRINIYNKKNEINNNIKKEENENEVENENERMKKIYESFPVFDIPDLKLQKEPLDNNQLRNEYQMKKNKKEGEILDGIKREKEEKRKQRLESFRNKFPIDSTKLTFDSNGKIIYLKKYNIENLQQELKLLPSKLKPIKNPNKKKLNNNINNKSNNMKIITDQINNEEEYKLDKNKKIIAGSNFLLFKPETGVLIKEDKKQKAGDFNFELKYNKSSIYDYYLKISSLDSKDCLSNNLNKKFLSNSKSLSKLLNTNIINKEKFENKNNKDINDERDDSILPYIGYKEEIIDNNPLFKNAIRIDQNINYNKKISIKKKLFPKISINNKNLLKIDLQGINKLSSLNLINISRKNITDRIFISERFKEYQKSLIEEKEQNSKNINNIYGGHISLRTTKKHQNINKNIINNLIKNKEKNEDLVKIIKFPKQILKNQNINLNIIKKEFLPLSPSYKEMKNRNCFSNRKRRIFSGNSNLIRNKSQIFNNKLSNFMI